MCIKIAFFSSIKRKPTQFTNFSSSTFFSRKIKGKKYPRITQQSTIKLFLHFLCNQTEGKSEGKNITNNSSSVAVSEKTTKSNQITCTTTINLKETHRTKNTIVLTLKQEQKIAIRKLR